MSFAHLKRIHGLGWLRLRGPCGAHDEFILAATAQNLKKLAKLAPQGNLIVTSREVVRLFLEQVRFEFVPMFHCLQGRFTT